MNSILWKGRQNTANGTTFTSREKFACIYVDDEHIEHLPESLPDMDFYWHTIDRRGFSARYHVYLPASARALSLGIAYRPCLARLRELLRAGREDRFVIRFSI